LVGARSCRFQDTKLRKRSDPIVETYFLSDLAVPKPGEEMDKLARIGRLRLGGDGLRSVLLLDDNPTTPLDNIWLDTGTGSFTEPQVYVVQTANKVIQRCILMATDPGDLVLDPTCGSGTTAYVAEQWGRRWITIDTSRVALALARAPG
jgi:adenine-specific DNA-methyltransferase